MPPRDVRLESHGRYIREKNIQGEGRLTPAEEGVRMPKKW